MKIIELDLSTYSAARPGTPVHLLFIHDTVGSQLMAGPGSANGESGILKTHPNGGGLRTMLGENNYVTHEAACGSKVGEETDICHWNRKFRTSMERILKIRHQDIVHADGTRNRVVMFQSGSESNWIETEGTEPGDPDSIKRSLANYKAAYRSLLKCFQQEPETLFVAFTAPPLVKPGPAEGIVRRIMDRWNGDNADEVGRRARSFNNWLKNVHSGWLKDYPLKNLVVFDYYDILTRYGSSNWLRYPSTSGKEVLPNAEGNRIAAQAFASFINRARNRMIQPANHSSGCKGYTATSKASAVHG